MKKIKYQFIPNREKHREGHPEDIAIDAANISEMLQSAGIDCEVRVDHVTGECTITHSINQIKPSGSIYCPTLSLAKLQTMDNLIKQMPQYMKEGKV